MHQYTYHTCIHIYIYRYQEATHRSQPSATQALIFSRSVMVSVAVSTVGMTELIFLNWPYGDGERPVLLRCLAVSTDASSNQACRKTLFIHKTTCCLRRNLSFLCSVISQDKVVALDRWGGKWNHLSMTPRLTTDCAKNYCNRTLIVKVIVENVVTCFLWDTVYSDVLCLNAPVCRLVLRHSHLSCSHLLDCIICSPASW